jgi:pantetheine-phosphate adenylyltransferase
MAQTSELTNPRQRAVPAQLRPQELFRPGRSVYYPTESFSAKIRGNIGAKGQALTAARETVSAIYPGSFDPITNGHLDLIERGSRMFDRLVVSILRNESKEPLFSVEERMEMLREVVQGYPNVEVDSFDGLLVDYAANRGATVLIRGIRAISDYEYELQMALMNRRLRPEIETVFMMSGEAYSFISSRLVKEVFGLGGNISGLVPPSVELRLRNRILG